VINTIISEHLFRNGRFEAGEKFCHESGVHLTESFKERFKILDEILTDLNKRDIGKAVTWVDSHISKLKIFDSDLPFLVHKVEFCHMLKLASLIQDQYQQVEHLARLVKYANLNLSQFYDKFKGQIQKLMGAIAFVNDINDSKYADLVSNVHWEYLTKSFVRDYCKIQGLSKESGLFMTLKVGTLGITKFQKFFKLIKGKEQLFDTKKNELPIEFSLGSDYNFHSIFICPVSREIATKENPPMLLKCGHCINKSSLASILTSANDRPGRKIKCPTCPKEIKVSDGIELKVF
jgi:hypothetical protein